MEFNFDDQKQTIMGVHIPDKKCYFIVRDSMHYTVMEGWQPTIKDVKESVQQYYHPDESTIKTFKEIFGQ